MQEIRPHQADSQHLGGGNFLLGKGIDTIDVEKAMVFGRLLQTYKFGSDLTFDSAVDFHLRIP
ncbi:hypothetical protein D3C80_1924410 [compost metagenome]